MDDYLKNKSNTIDPLERIIDIADSNQIILFGEDHLANNNQGRRFVAETIPFIKQLGYDYLAVEIDAGFQEQMDDYFFTGTFQSELKYRLEVDMCCDEYYYSILEAARKNQMRIIRIDNTQAVEYLFFKQNIDFNHFWSELFKIREPLLYENVENILLENEDPKLVILLGYMHAN